ncbi:MAG: response regulator [Rhodoferax sp.]|uniref:hybrid sensor histidine kinase/response regulator n=1 Tax=Rhodoferax sp. TaxID=50421 RepID=UPI0013FEC112|nr:Hpt domain-containing protein [Rhodoferax sp.]NDP37489.1 response regulator [Rhodoferax sp.]
MQVNAAPTGANEPATHDLGPLAWVLDELRKSLTGATKALRRFVRDAELARGSDLAALDASQLRIARQQLHQAVGALEMVGMAAPAKILRSMEALAQRFVQRPELCSDEAANKVERASFALTEYLEGVLKGKSASSVALFPQYRDVLELVGNDRVHPADLWPLELRWIDVVLPQAAQALAYDSSVRPRLDRAVLEIVKSGDVAAAQSMCGISLGFAAAQTELEARVFWKISAAYFEAVSLGLCPADVYGKLAASRILLQFRTLARGEPGISERLVQDLLFFCAQAVPMGAADAPVLAAVRAAYGLTQTKSFDYERPQFGRFDPALLVQARKRIAAVTETWSALAGGDTNRLKVALDQFSLVTDSVLKMHPESGDLVRALMQAIEKTALSGEAPAPALAMEVATVVLYLEAAYDDLDPTDSQMRERSSSLAARMEHVNAGGQPEPLEAWMEELYRRVSDRQIMGSVVDELRTTLGGVEKSLDSFFRNPLDKVPLHEVPSQLAQMRGVFSVLGLDQAALAALRMRDSVEKFLVDDVDADAARAGIFEKLGNSLGALGFLIDMLSYQRTLAKKLFVYDEELGEFKPLMGREKTTDRTAEIMPVPNVDDVDDVADDVPAVVEIPFAGQPTAVFAEAPAPVVVLAPELVSPVVAAPEDDDETELKDIFLEEAREVVQAGLEAIRALADDPSDMGQQTTLRRAFHTLKGSSRMVGFNEFGEAAWSLEQLLNTWLAEQKPASPELVSLANRAMHGFDRWVEDIAAGEDAQWNAQAFRRAADGLRLDNTEVALVFPGEEVQGALPDETPHVDFVSTQIIDLDVTQSLDVSRALAVDGAGGPSQAVWAADEPLALDDFDFGVDVDVTPSPDEADAGLNAQDQVETFSGELAELASEVDDFEPEPHQASLLDMDLEEQVKVIGSLRIGIPLYNVYLNEADELSRRLLTELSEWALELHRPVAETTVALAHSLAGSSATVGFFALSEMARALEHALQHVRLHVQGIPEHAQAFIAAAEDMRRLLHQFAAGFLKEPDQALLDALKAILDIEFPGVSAGVVDSFYYEMLDESQILEPFDVDQSADDVMPDGEAEAEAEAEAVPLVVAETDLSDAGLTPVPAGPDVLADAVLSDQNLAEPLEPPPDVAALVIPAVAGAEVEHIDALDALDVDLFPIFEEEALELLPQLGGALRQWMARPDNLGARNEVLRVLHTVKGSGRLAGAMQLGEMTHRMESAIEQMGTESLSTAQLEPLLARFDAIQANFDQLRSTPEQALSLPELSLAIQEETAPVALSETMPAGSEATKAATPDRSAFIPRAAPRPGAQQTVRVRSQLLDRLVNQAGEVMITRSRMEARLGQLRGSLGELTGNLDRLRSQLRDIEVQSESQMQSRLAQAKDTAKGFDPLEFDRFTRVQEITRMMAESVHDVATVQRNLQRAVEGSEDDLIAQGRQARELQRDLLRTRMVEFDGISDRLYGVVRQAAKEANKQVKLDIKGGSLDMDRGVLDRMAPVFEHLLRNSVAHGIEDSALRVAAGKPAAGSIGIHLQQQSNDVTVEFSDDGAGLDLDRVREKARANGLTPEGGTLTDAEAVDLIFSAGFSTAAQVTELAGRGIGMDIVRSEVNALGGRIETSTERGQGTKFKLVLPLTTAVTQVVMLRIGESVVGVSANLVEMVRRVPAADLERAYQDQVFAFDGEQLPFFWGGALLQASTHSHEAIAKTLPVVIFRSAGQRIAAHIDEVLGNQEVVVKNLGPQLSRLPGLTGMSVLASGAVVLIYNPVALASVYGERARHLSRNAMQPVGEAATSSQDFPLASVSQMPLVLVVDDSITVRRVTQRLLKREGFRVALAIDGLQALERLQEEKPAVVLSDIEMPRMDGFDLVRNIRGDVRLRDLPIIMITSRIAEKHRERARELGVDHYLGKPYSEDELIGLVRQYCLSTVEN